MKTEPLTLTPHWGDRMRDSFHTWRSPNKIEFAVLFVSTLIVGAVAVALV